MGGTALTDDHLVILHRFTNRLAFAFDADAAGSAATRRAVDLALSAGFLLSVVVLPVGTDPADLAIRDPEAWNAALAARQDAFSFLLQRALATQDRTSAEGKRAISADVLPIIARIPDGVIQGEYVQQLAAALRVDPRFLYDDLRRAKDGLQVSPAGAGEGPRSGAPAGVRQPPVDPQVRREERVLVLLLAEPAFIPGVAQRLSEKVFTAPQTREFYTALCLWYDQAHPPRSDSVSTPQGEEGGEPPVSAAQPGTGHSVAAGRLAEYVPQHLQIYLDHLLLAVEVEREEGEPGAAREVDGLVRAMVLTHLRGELTTQTEELRSAQGERRSEILGEVARLASEIAHADRANPRFPLQ